MKFIISPLLTLITLTLFSQSKDSVELKLYQQACEQYDAFEKQIGHYIQTENVKMHYITLGDTTGTPLIWIHGTGSTSWEILSFSDQLKEMGCYIISIDYYGHGQTPMPKEEKSVYHVADDIHFLMQHLNIDKAVIGGWSRGGYIATAFYDEYPESCLGLILVDGGSANGLVPRYKLERSVVLEQYREIEFPEEYLYTYPTRYEAYCSMVDITINDPQIWILDGLQQYEDGTWGYNVEIWEAVANESVESMIEALESPPLAPLLCSSCYMMLPEVIYRKLDVPMLIIDPIQEEIAWQDYAPENEKLAKMHPDLVFHQKYEDTSHSAHFERPERFLKEVEELLNVVKNK